MKALTSALMIGLTTVVGKVENSVSSDKQEKTMLIDFIEANELGEIPTDFRLIYEWQTVREFFDDGTDASFLISTFTLENLQTKLLVGDITTKTDDIRVTVGWRNPQEDAYDLTSIDIEYWQDTDKLVYKCYDGYANGSISTKDYYTIDGAASPVDIYGRHNITVPEWTIYKNPIGFGDTYYRVPEINDCQVISGSATPRADFGEDADETIVDAAVKQTFVITTRKPFEANSLQDVPLIPGDEYNVTIYFGCFRDEVNNGQYYGTENTFAWNADGWGCRELMLTSRQTGIDHLIASGGVEESVYNADAIAERQLVFKLLDGSIQLVAAAGALFGAATVLF